MSRLDRRNAAAAKSVVRRGVAAWCCGALLATAPGCSLVFVKGPPKHLPPTANLTCTESDAAPIIDTVFAVGWSALTIAAAADAARGCPPNQLCFSSLAAGSAVVTGVFAVATGVSAWYGYSKTSRCRDATACTRGDRAACEKLDWALRPPDDAVRRALERDGDLIPPPDPREPSPDFR